MGDLRKIFRGCQRMAKVPKHRRNIAENFNRLSREGARTLQTTDSRTGDNIIEREREFTFAKNSFLRLIYVYILYCMHVWRHKNHMARLPAARN